MRKFVYKIFIFFGLPFIIFISITLFFYHTNLQKTELRFKHISEYKYLLMGDSQIQRIDNKFFSEGTYNFASSGEHFYFTYQKLLKIFRYKKHKTTKIVLGVSIHNFAPVYNRLFNVKFSEGIKSLKRYIYFIDIFTKNEFTISLADKPIDVIKSIYQEPDWGGLNKSNKENPDSKIIKLTLNMHYKIKNNESEFCVSQKKYLNLIDSLCIANNVELFIVSLPYHPEYRDNIQKKYLDFFHTTISELENSYHINFLEDTVNIKWMSDANHLNEKGSLFYSNKINAMLYVRTHNRR